MLTLAIFDTSFLEVNLLWDRHAPWPENVNRESVERRHGIRRQSNRLDLNQGAGQAAYLDLGNGRLSIPIQQGGTVIQAFAGSWPNKPESAQFLQGVDQASHQVRATVLFELERLFNKPGKITLTGLFEKPEWTGESYSSQDGFTSPEKLAAEQAIFAAHRSDYLAKVKAAKNGFSRVVMVDDFRTKYEQKDRWEMALYRGRLLELIYGEEFVRSLKNNVSL